MLKKLTSGAWWILTALSLLAVVLAACGGGEESTTGPTPTGGAAVQGTKGASPGAASTPTGMSPVIETPSSVASPTPPLPVAEMGIDTIPGGEVDVSRTVTGTGPIGVDIVVLNAGPGFALYQFKVQWDPTVLAYDSQVDLTPDDMNVCSVPTVGENTVYSGCGRLGTEVSFTGPVNRLTFHCVGQGTSTLHLVTLGEDDQLGSTLFAFGGYTVSTATSDVSVECTG